MSSAAELRLALDKFGIDHDLVNLVKDHPNCACEEADATENGHGRVDDDEVLRYFVTSKSNVTPSATGYTSPLKPSMFARAFKVGLSVVRLGKASPEELDNTASEQHQNQVNAHKEKGGVVGVIDFTALNVRRHETDNTLLCCVFDTPMDGKPSHADIAFHRAVPDEEGLGMRYVLFNQIGGHKGYKKAKDVDDMNLAKYLPKVMQPS